MLDRYNGPQPVCYRDTNCDPLALGKLIRGLKMIGLYPVPESFATKSSVKAIFTDIRSIELVPLCEEYYRKAGRKVQLWDQYDGEAKVHMDKELETSLSRIQDQLYGLELRNGDRRTD